MIYPELLSCQADLKTRGGRKSSGEFESVSNGYNIQIYRNFHALLCGSDCNWFACQTCRACPTLFDCL